LPSIDGFELTPIARLVDTDQYRGADPDLTLTGPVGIGEFTSANFFGEFIYRPVGLHPKHPFPDLMSSVVGFKDDEYFDPKDPTKKLMRRYYFRKLDDRGNGYRLATVGLLNVM
jgi:hypothetical protein